MPGKFKLVNDNGILRTIPVPELLYCISVSYKIISPQYIDQCWKKNKLGTFSTRTDGDGTVLLWTDKRGTRYSKTVPHLNESNIPICHSAPRYGKYRNYLKDDTQDRMDEKELVSCLASTNIIQDRSQDTSMY
jgi:hypothetical protein